ncbi:integrase [Dyadobacter luteus]|jgi:integrase/recombinase XerC|uniref:Tyrosine recombinase XerC n=1 Tax=Dyadobacter luteus TaxID=2259619 RepID=A0A3D8Y822_9BACT|nr:tyrosine-type recombinase/integrase [Dyadobacter luteus]REA59306.1 integrase [Dyadobacter luteus]
MINAYLESLEFEKRSSEHTISSYKTDLEQFSKFLLDQYEIAQPDTASPAMLRSWVVKLMEDGLSPVSVNRKIASLRSLYGFLRKKGLVKQDPSKMLSVLKTRKKLPVYVEEKAMELLFEAAVFPEDDAGLRDKLIMELLYGSGIRLSEILGLETSHVDLRAKTIRVLGKRAKERLIPVSASVIDLLAKYMVVRAPDEDTNALIITDSGKAAYPVFIQRVVKKYLSAVTTLQQKSPHVLRHTYATHLLNRGADLNAIKELLGHTNLAATQIYTHNSIEKLKKTHQQAHPKA